MPKVRDFVRDLILFMMMTRSFYLLGSRVVRVSVNYVQVIKAL